MNYTLLTRITSVALMLVTAFMTIVSLAFLMVSVVISQSTDETLLAASEDSEAYDFDTIRKEAKQAALLCAVQALAEICGLTCGILAFRSVKRARLVKLTIIFGGAALTFMVLSFAFGLAGGWLAMLGLVLTPVTAACAYMRIKQAATPERG